MSQENHIGERIGVKDAERVLASDGSLVPVPRSYPTVVAVGVAEGGDGGGGAAASLHEQGLHEPEPDAQPAAPSGAAIVAPATANRVVAVSLDDEDDDVPKKKKAARDPRGPHKNNVRKLRIERMMSKAELARRANLSVLTIDRVEKGFGCRMDSKRKILEALGLSLADRVRVFGEEE
jgi:DNA-binding XRE family transcriptional regulator